MENRVKEREIEVGGEILRTGSKVVVYDGREYDDCGVTRIGTRRIYIEVRGRESAFSIESRVDTEKNYGYTRYFRTKTEVAAVKKRERLIGRLFDLGLQPTRVDGKGSLRHYPDEALEQIIAVLDAHKPE